MEGAPKHLVMPAFSFPPTDKLAQVILDAWASESNPHGLEAKLLERDPTTNLPTPGAVKAATDAVNAADLNLTRAVVITEAEHDNDYIMQSDDEIVFVLPKSDRAKATPAGNLLATAKFLMACTPNGI
jgi:hypothetical protein